METDITPCVNRYNGTAAQFCTEICPGSQNAPTSRNKLYINYQLDAPIIIYLSINIILLHVSSHECSSSGGYIVYMQHMVLSFSMRAHGGQSTGHHELS